jgi:broad specificity phosphatase PhoE
MGVLTLVRHGQASLFADNYDELSALGREQARLLGEFWGRRRIEFDEVYCGPRARQRQTAEIAGSACIRAGRRWPEPMVLPEFDEYDLGGVLQTLAPALSQDDPAFAELLANYQRAEAGPDREHSFRRVFESLTMHWVTAPDSATGVESFQTFRNRVERGLHIVMGKPGSGRRVALFTSGGVIGASVRLALDAPDRMALEVNWRVRNCSLTEFVFSKGRFTLDGFNALPHLEDPALWTYW